jgi:hypothetical protein
MFKGFNNRQQNGFPLTNFFQDISAYGYGGVTFWLDAAFGLNTQTNLGAVSRWMPRVGASPFIQDTVASQPRFILNDANYNNFPSVQTVSDRNMSTPAGQGLKLTQNSTILIVSKVDVNTNTNGIIGLASPQNCIFDGGNTAGYNGFGFLGSAIQFQGTTESTSARIKIITSTNIIINGSVEATGSIGNANADLITLFRGNNLGGNGALIGSIAEIIAFNYSMTSTDAIALSDRINQKYALY